MRPSLPLFILSLFFALIFVAGCIPPSSPTCSPYIGQATINEVSKVKQNPSNSNSGDDANDFVEVKIMSAALTAATLSSWRVIVCEQGDANCYGAALSTATITGTGANRYYVVKSLTSIARHINFAVGTEIALADQNDSVVDYLTVGGATGHQPSCTFAYDTDATTVSSTRRIRRIPDGTGNWDVVNGNSEAPTEGTSNDSGVAQHVAIAHSGTASTCRAVNVTVSLHSSGHVLASGFSGTINLATSTGRGQWTPVTGSGVFSETGGADDGGASYTFSAGETSAVFGLRHGQPGIVNINVSGAASEDSTEDPALTFSDVALLIETSAGVSIPTQIAGKDSNVGWNASTVHLQAVATNPDTGVCTALFADGNQDVELAYECVDPAACSGSNLLSIGGTAVARNNSGSVSSYTTRSLAFAGSIATIPLNYRDAGRITVHARKSLTDGSGLTLSGAATVNVRPFALGFTGIVSGATNNPSGTANTGSGFAAAGSAFSSSVGAYLFATGEDANYDGIADSGAVVTDNGVTPGFAFAGAQISMPDTLLTPAISAPGVVAGTLVAPAAVNFSAGTASLSNMTYSEVGSLRLRAVASDYLGIADADIQGDSPDIGRFYPQDFVLAAALVTPACSAPDATPLFTYMGQPMAVSFTLQAHNAAGAVTQNYDTSAGYAPGTGAATLTWVAEDSNAGINLGSRLSVAAGRWDRGIYVRNDGDSSFVASDAILARDAGVDGPFGSLQLGVDLSDPDGRDIAGLDLQAAAAGMCAGCTEKAIGATTAVRYGRLAMRNTTGSDLASAITIPVYAEYYNGSGFVRNVDDGCTLYGSTQINDVNYSGALQPYYADARGTAAGNWSLPASDLAMSGGALQPYPNGLHVVPVAGETGELGVTLGGVPAWLLFNGLEPSAILTLGQYRGHDRIIYQREMH